jgi:DNA-binding NarL/FixJ family response regulator
MAKNRKVNIVCYDDHRGFAEDVRKRFEDTSQCNVLSYNTREGFIDHLKEEEDHDYCKIAILGAHETLEQFEMLYQLSIEIKEIDMRTCLIILGPKNKMEEIKETIRFNVDAYIPKNANAILRIHNIVKKLISEYNIRIFKRRRNLSFYLLLTFLLLSGLSIIIAYFRFPEYF